MKNADTIFVYSDMSLLYLRFIKFSENNIIAVFL